MRSLGVKVPARQAEEVRRRLREGGLLRDDMRVRHEGADIVFPVTGAPSDLRPATFDFEARPSRPRDYTDLLPEGMAPDAPRAFDVLGDIVIVKVPPALWDQRADIGEALRAFHDARAVFHDHGVQGEFRTRNLERIAGESGTRTTVSENGFRIAIDPARAYFSPRLADERARLVALAQPGERVIDLFGGVAPLGIQLARKGCQVVSVDLNPAAVELAAANVAANHVELELVQGDAREVGPGLDPADRVVMNLPHAARDFLDVALPLVKPGGMLHHHEILQKALIDARREALADELALMGRNAHVTNIRHVRDYSAAEAHYAIDLRL